MAVHVIARWKAFVTIGAIASVVAVGYSVLAFRLPFGSMNQPGAGVFPVVVGIVTLISGLITILEGLRGDRAAVIEMPAGVDAWRSLGVLATAFGFLIVLPWLGQLISSFLACTVLVLMLSTWRWWQAVIAGAAISISLYLVFVVVLKVPLSRGVFLL